MAFTWINSTTGKVEGDDKSTSIFKEIKTNIQSLYTTLGLGTVSYSEDISDNFIRTSNITEIRNKIDYADNNKIKCTTVNTSVKSSVFGTYYNGYYSGYDSGYYGSDYGGAYNGSYYGSDYQSGHNPYYYSGNNYHKTSDDYTIDYGY